VNPRAVAEVIAGRVHPTPNGSHEARAEVATAGALTDADLLARGLRTLVASRGEYARGAPGAAVHHLAGVAAAVFPREPERGVYNNALLGRDLAAGGRSDAIAAMEAAYAAAGVTRFAAWVHESDTAMLADLRRRGYTVDESTRAMGMELGAVCPPAPEIDLGPPDWRAHLQLCGMRADFLSGADPAAYRILIGRIAGESVATAIAYDFDGDCGIFNVGTLERARRRGLATALSAIHLRDARARGCRTASVQSTAMAERVYAAVGFRDLGRILEYVR
jgi:ribosomal protein S18 acetylase RimI-like enzyme